jgi:hypothetical protein
MPCGDAASRRATLHPRFPAPQAASISGDSSDCNSHNGGDNLIESGLHQTHWCREQDSKFRFLVARPSNRHGRRDCCLENGSGSVGEPKVRIHLPPAGSLVRTRTSCRAMMARGGSHREYGGLSFHRFEFIRDCNVP